MKLLAFSLIVVFLALPLFVFSPLDFTPEAEAGEWHLYREVFWDYTICGYWPWISSYWVYDWSHEDTGNNSYYLRHHCWKHWSNAYYYWYNYQTPQAAGFSGMTTKQAKNSSKHGWNWFL